MEFRANIYQELVDSLHAGKGRAEAVGKRTVMPSSFIGGPRDMRRRYMDAMALVRRFDKPDTLHHDTHLPTLICWQMIGFDNTLCVGNCTTLLKTRKLSAMMLYGYRLTVGIPLRTMKLSANVFRQNKCRRFLNKPTI